MIIDAHAHPIVWSDISSDRSRFKHRCHAMGIDLLGPVSMDLLEKQNKFAKVDKMVLLPHTSEQSEDDSALANEEIAYLCRLKPDVFIGFATVQPMLINAKTTLQYAFEDLGLSGLKLNTAKLKLHPNDPLLLPLYEMCQEYRKPIIFHSGMSWSPGSLSKYARPVEFEEVAMNFPEVNICLSHLGWPWVEETVSLLIKYPNVYTDTSAAYLDSPGQFFEHVFTRNYGEYWIEHNFADKVMFGSNMPRFRPARILHGLDQMPFSDETRRKIYGDNAQRFLRLGV